jgi:hypothetical protein
MDQLFILITQEELKTKLEGVPSKYRKYYVTRTCWMRID